jgi:uncharacterized protein (TIGR00369 family)
MVSNPLFQLAKELDDGQLTDVGPDFASSIPDDCLLADLAIELVKVGRGSSLARMVVRRGHLNQRGVAQAGSVVALADAAAGWASDSALEDGRFTTLSLDISLIRPVVENDVLIASATTVHLGRRTHLLEVTIAKESAPGKPVARFSCQQLVLGGNAA